MRASRLRSLAVENLEIDLRAFIHPHLLLVHSDTLDQLAMQGRGKKHACAVSHARPIHTDV